MKRSILRHILLAATVLCVIWCSTGCGAAVEAIRQLREGKTGSNDPVTEAEQLKPPQDVQSAKTDGESEQEQESPDTNSEWNFEQTQVPQLDIEKESYHSFCNQLKESGKMAGVSFIGYVSSPMNEEEYMNLLYRRGYMEEYDFLADIPADRIFQTEGGHRLYCIIPADPDGSITVNQWILEGEHGYATMKGQPGDFLYSSDSGKPFLLICGNRDLVPDDHVQVVLEDSAGNTNLWYPRLVNDELTIVSDNEQQLLDFSLENIQTKNTKGDWEIATPEILHGEWAAWDAHTDEGEPLVCSLSFYQDEEGNERVEYFYGPPTGEIYAWYEGEFVPSATPDGWITEDMSEFRMQLVGGAVMETGLPPGYDGEEPSDYLGGVNSIRYYPDTDVIEVGNQFGEPLMEGTTTIVFERIVG